MDDEDSHTKLSQREESITDLIDEINNRYKECGEIFPEVLWLTAKAKSQWLNYFYYGRLPRPSVIIHVEPCSEECGQCPIPTDRRKKRP